MNGIKYIFSFPRLVFFRIFSVIDRYLYAEVFKSFFVILLVFTAVVWMAQAFRYISYIVDYGISFGAFLQTVFLVIPAYIARLLPLSLAMGTIFAHMNMMQNREGIVLSVIGLSPRRLAQSFIGLGLMGYIGLLFLTVFIEPRMQARLSLTKDYMSSKISRVFLEKGVFTDLGMGKFVAYVGNKTDEGLLEDILLEDQRDPSRFVTYMAQWGAIVKIEDEQSGEIVPAILIRQGNQQVYSRQDGRLQMLYFDRYLVPIIQKDRLEMSGSTSVFDISTHNLWRSLNKDNSRSQRIVAELFRRFFDPLLILGWPLFVFVIFGLFSYRRGSVWLQFLVSVISVLGIQMLSNVFYRAFSHNIGADSGFLYVLSTIFPFLFGIFGIIYMSLWQSLKIRYIFASLYPKSWGNFLLERQYVRGRWQNFHIEAIKKEAGTRRRKLDWDRG